MKTNDWGGNSGLAGRALVLGMAIAGLALAAGGRAQVMERPIPADPVKIDSGLIAGKLLTSGVKAYFGVPYAAPPVRELRWREPQPVIPWSGVFYAVRFAPETIQLLRAHKTNHYFQEEATSEDCLYLNLWAPGSAALGAKLPVIMWIHGGGFIQGSPNMPNYSGEGLAKKGVVYVGIVYRLGALGYMAHPELTAESPHHASGNYGYLDQVAALQWIHRNIAAFGGDPENVTIMGQSAGAASVFRLEISPLARGLFSRIIGVSGGGLRPGSPATTLKEGEKLGVQFQEAIKVESFEPGHPPLHEISEMRDVPADRILAAQQTFHFTSLVDGYYMPAAPAEIFAAGRQIDVPIMIGFTRDESWNDLHIVRNLADFHQVAKAYFGDRAEEFLRLYPAATDAEARQQGAQAASDGGQGQAIRSWAAAQVRTGKAPVYVYTWSHVHPVTPGVKITDFDVRIAGAEHTGDLPYFLQTLDAYNRLRRVRDWTPFDRELSDWMSDAIVAFARDGNPATAAVAFPPYTAEKEHLIDFGDHTHVAAFDKARMDFFSTAAVPLDIR